jgi:hypothetical protein
MYTEYRDVLAPARKRKDKAYLIFRLNGYKPRDRVKWKAQSARFTYLVRKGKTQYFVKQTREMERHRARNDPAAAFATCKRAKLESAAQHGRTIVWESTGTKTLSDPVEVSDRVTEYHAGVIGQSKESWKNVCWEPIRATVVPDADRENLPEWKMLSNPTSAGEPRSVVTKMKLGKVPGPGGEPTELADAIAGMVNEVLVSGVVPQHMKDATFKNLYKEKGDPRDCNNYRGITLLSHVGKLVTKLIAVRLDRYVEAIGILPEEQCVFRKKRGTIDMLLVTRQIAELSKRSGEDLHAVFVDLTKAYYTVNRGVMWDILTRTNVPPNSVEVIRNLHEGMRATRTSSLSSEVLVTMLVPMRDLSFSLGPYRRRSCKSTTLDTRSTCRTSTKFHFDDATDLFQSNEPVFRTFFRTFFIVM